MEKDEFEKYYKSIEKIFCPYFNEYVHFTELGYEHLRFKNKNSARTTKDRLMRISLIPIAVKKISLSSTLQGKSSRNRFEERFVNNRKEIALRYVQYFEFLAIICDRKSKVVVKQIENQEIIFLSIIPLYKQKSPPTEGDGFS